MEAVNSTDAISPRETLPLDSLDDPLLSETEAARFLGISKMTLLRKRKAGLIGFFQVGFRVLYSKNTHLLPYLAECERKR